MKAQRALLALLGTGCLVLGSLAAQASRIPGDVISGPVTTVTRQSVTIQGHEYHIRQGSPAVNAVGHVVPGQDVEVHLDGPANSSHSEVINVISHK